MAPKKRSKVYQRTFVGCWTCRRRKIKCDATRPHCQRCSKSKLQCEGYDVKLNWSPPLIVKHNEMQTLGEDDQDNKFEETSFQRSNISLCKWNIYKHYEDIDDDIERVHETKAPRNGPFAVFRYKEHEEFSGDEESFPTNTNNTNNNNNNNNSTGNASTSRKIPLSRSVSPWQELSSIKTPQNHQIHRSLLNFVKLTLKSRNFPESTQSIFPLPKPSLKIQDTELPNDLAKLVHIDNERVTITKYITRSMDHFFSIIPKVFHNDDYEFNNNIKTVTKSALGNYMIYNNDHDLLFLLNITIASLLNQQQQQQQQAVDEALILHKISKNLYNTIYPNYQLNDATLVSIMLMIMINSTFGVYDQSLFEFDASNQSPTYALHYELLVFTNHLVNHQSYKLDTKYSKLYEDLSENYNLLKIKNKNKNINQKNRMINNNGYGVIHINTQETPEDQIMKVPRHHDFDDEYPTLDEEEKPPPTIVINFAQEEDDENDGDEDDEGDDEDGDVAMSGTMKRSFSDPLFKNEFEETLNKENLMIFGVSNCLVYLFNELVKLINHKRIFNKIGITSRNFPKICADFEDVLIKADNLHTQSPNDTAFYNMLMILCYKLVGNYPSKMLNYHFIQLDHYLNEIQGPPMFISLVWFTKFALEKREQGTGLLGFDKLLNNDTVWLNNWEAKQLILELDEYGSTGDWEPYMKKQSIDPIFMF